MHSIGDYGAFVVDLDGVCYLDGQLFEGVPEALHEIESSGSRLVFVTNNSYRSPKAFARILTAGPFRCDPSQVLTSSAAAAALMKKALLERSLPRGDAEETEHIESADLLAGEPQAQQVVVAGGEGVYEAVRTVGMVPVAPEEWADQTPPPGVIVGIDRSFDYRRLSLLARFIREGAEFVATNEDPTYPTPDGLVPGAGAVVAAVEVASGRKARVAGKPHWPMVELVSQILGDLEALVVGDRWDTDLAFAHRLGFDSALVLSGVGSIEDAVSSPCPPKFVARSLPELLKDPVVLVRTEQGRLEVEGGKSELARAVQEAVSSASEANHGSSVDPYRAPWNRG